MRPLTELSRLLLPVACPCGVPDVRWCARCAARFAAAPVRVEHGAGRLDRVDAVAPLPVWALTAYTGRVRDVVVHWKDRGRADLDRPLGAAARRGAARLAPLLAAALAELGPATSLAVVPVPASAAARRRRGRDPVAALAGGVAAGLRAGGVRARVAPVLRRRATRDQVGLGARARGRNLASAVRAVHPLDALVCLLVDDVLTSGATLATSERALETAGASVLGATVLAATPPPGATTGDERMC
ncbi:hypothetical protein GCM10009751_19730 [Myceligenerans crystallogenes]|uniref:Amidophosphoribosyltransferase n=1 Tax=Myceligenerans crystallogenes TaxID=316335 RepID=A0ABN2NBR4_9MICO